MQLKFLGAVGTVTGSKHLVSTDTTKLLVDCGLFQGPKELRLKNWGPLPFNPRELDAVVLTHAHLDHCGALPLLAQSGFEGPIYCSKATRELTQIILMDSARLQEEEAETANRRGYSKHTPAKPLYTQDDALEAIRSLEPIPYSTVQTCGDMEFDLLPAGHILGASMIRIRDGKHTVLFTGDIGRPHDLLIQAPHPLPPVDCLVMESTYGDRSHAKDSAEDQMAALLQRVIQRGGSLIIPAFAVGRAQLLLFILSRLFETNRVPRIPVFLDSPMAIDASKIFRRYRGEHRLSNEECELLCTVAKRTNTRQQSEAIATVHGPCVIVAGSGMVTGGRVLTHLERLASDPRNAILLAGYQAPGTRGDSIARGEKSVKIRGRFVSIMAEVLQLDGLSAHADADEMIFWVAAAQTPPRQIQLVHGEPHASAALASRLVTELKIPSSVAAEEALELGGTGVRT